LRRAGLTPGQIRAIQRAFTVLFRERRNLRQALADVEQEPLTAEVRELIDFIRSSTRGVCVGPRTSASEAEA